MAEGKQVRLLKPGGGHWVVFECETEQIAKHTVRELQAWSKAERQTEEFKRLCQAQ